MTTLRSIHSPAPLPWGGLAARSPAVPGPPRGSPSPCGTYRTSAAPGEAAHPPARVAGVGVEVVGDLTHHGIDVEPALAKALGADAHKGGEHVGPIVLGGLG